MERLFSYGTLQEERVQCDVFGHTVQGVPDAIVGYRLEKFTITDQRAIAISGKADHTILEPTGRDADLIEGSAFELTAEELRRADAYEDAAYKRVQVQLRSGLTAWVYVRA